MHICLLSQRHDSETEVVAVALDLSKIVEAQATYGSYEKTCEM